MKCDECKKEYNEKKGVDVPGRPFNYFCSIECVLTHYKREMLAQIEKELKRLKKQLTLKV